MARWVLVVGVTLVLVFELVGTDPSGFNRTALYQLAWINNFALVANTLLLRKVFGSLISPVVLFATFLSLFSSGQLILVSFGATLEVADVLTRESVLSLCTSSIFFIEAYTAFCGAAVLVGVFGRRRRKAKTPAYSRAVWQASLVPVGWASIAVGVVPLVIDQYHNLQVVLSQGYSDYYAEGARLTNSFFGLTYFVIVGIIFLGLCGRPRYATRSAIAIGAIALLRLAAGDRGEGLIYLATAMVLWANTTKGTSRRRVVPVAFTLFALVIIPAIGTLRHTFSSSGASALSDAFTTDNPLKETLRTVGNTLFPLVKITEQVPDTVPFAHGRTYLAGLFNAVPYGLQPSALHAVSGDPLYAKPAAWLQSRLHLSYGPGFTPFAEAYLNFGWTLGIATMAMIGAVVAQFLRIPDRASDAWPIKFAMVLAVFALLGFSVRSSFNFAPAFLLRYIAVPSLAVLVVAEHHRRTNRRLHV